MKSFIHRRIYALTNYFMPHEYYIQKKNKLTKRKLPSIQRVLRPANPFGHLQNFLWIPTDHLTYNITFFVFFFLMQVIFSIFFLSFLNKDQCKNMYTTYIYLNNMYRKFSETKMNPSQTYTCQQLHHCQSTFKNSRYLTQHYNGK